VAFLGLIPAPWDASYWVVGERCGFLGKERDKVWSVNEL
jgi:hypothetical protein